MPNLYTIHLVRGEDEDDPDSHGNDLAGAEQVAAEMQEAMVTSGLPVGFFCVEGPREISWAEWDELRR